MSLIREKASESEAVVRRITSEIQALDRAKANLIASMTALKRLQMLVNALAQLEEYTEGRRYGEAAESLGAVESLKGGLKAYGGAPKVKEVMGRVGRCVGRLRELAEKDFEAQYARFPLSIIKLLTLDSFVAFCQTTHRRRHLHRTSPPVLPH